MRVSPLLAQPTVPLTHPPALPPCRPTQVQSLSSLSSREHILSGKPRCFERAVLCNLVGMYTGSGKHHWGELRPKTAGRRVSARLDACWLACWLACVLACWLAGWLASWLAGWMCWLACVPACPPACLPLPACLPVCLTVPLLMLILP